MYGVFYSMDDNRFRKVLRRKFFGSKKKALASIGKAIKLLEKGAWVKDPAYRVSIAGSIARFLMGRYILNKLDEG